MNVISRHPVISFKCSKWLLHPKYKNINAKMGPTFSSITFSVLVHEERCGRKWNEWIINLIGKSSYIMLFAWKSTQIDNIFSLSISPSLFLPLIWTDTATTWAYQPNFTSNSTAHLAMRQIAGYGVYFFKWNWVRLTLIPIWQYVA